MKTSNPFDDLKITVNQKGLFEAFCHEWNQIKLKKKISILAKIVHAGYDLNLVVEQYLYDKSAIEDRRRIYYIVSAFNLYSVKILESKLDYCETINELAYISPKLEESIRAFYKDKFIPQSLKDSIDACVKIINEAFSIREMLDLYSRKEEDYKMFSYILDIDLDEDIGQKLYEKDEEEGNPTLWRYSELFSWFKHSLLSDLVHNRIKYIHPSNEMPCVQIYNAFLKKYYPVEDHQRLMEDEKFRKERLLDFSEKVVKVLWKNEPLFDEPVYLVRCNYTGKAASQIDNLYEENIVSICIEESEDIDQAYFDDLINDKNPAFNSSLPYVYRFVNLIKLVEKEDVIVIATYLGKLPKIGIIKKGSEMFSKNKNGYKLYCLQMKSVYCTPPQRGKLNSIDLRDYPILKSIIPQQVTISAVLKRKKAIYSIYYGINYPLELSLLSDMGIEIMCTEWLRSKFAKENIKICYQLLRTGGNYADVDILGVNSMNEVVASQVSNTADPKLIRKKIDKLLSFPSEEKIMFTLKYNPDFSEKKDYVNIFIEDVWEDFMKDEFYKKMLERLTNL